MTTSTDTRRETVLDVALTYAVTRNELQAATALQPLGIDILRDPLAMASLSVLADCAAFGVKPSPRALLHLGCGEAA